ncbi:uncharacterized protein J7T54_004613 [Emericellopsis cladophorae]|uniref:Cyclochlorotine biosynthesis protein O n=1 Tax=Emericellopsis cladophorae TaxID=2686198 RepID=A0A9Q0BFK1_9HYPO|nr:uncharacterized protein J7T54_004613 [Emericellopsis cladophorae]KAI6784067.1 hypothetical protein J7T54_004613 [Emericellopsis cladophorae]
MNHYEDPSRSASLSDDEESQRLIEKHDQPVKLHSRGSSIVTCKRVYMVLLHGIVLILVVTLCMGIDSKGPNPRPTKGASWSPVREHIEHELNAGHATDHHKYSQYSGWPSPKQDEAWDDLMRPVYFNATRDELEKAGESFENIAELEGGGYPASLGVYHELHCLRQLRFWLWKDRYYGDLTEAQDDYFHGHLDHCIETLRLTIMCNGNPAVYSFYWDDPAADHPATQSNSENVCAKWESIENWGYERRISTDPDIVRPSMDEMMQ